MASDTAERLQQSSGLSPRELLDKLLEHRGGPFSQRLAKGALAALRLWAPEAKDLAEAWERSLVDLRLKPVALGYSSGLRGGMPKRAGDAAAPPVRGKRAKAGEPRLQGGYKVGDEVYCNVDEKDSRFFAYSEFKGKVEAVVEEGYEVHFDVIDVTDVFSVHEVRPRPVPHHTPCAPPHPPRTPPRQHVHAV